MAITWTNAPEDQYPILGEDYVVKCEVKADPNPTIDWLRNGDQVSETRQTLPTIDEPPPSHPSLFL